jgi:hypothetical protein
MKKKFITETLRVAQVPKRLLDKKTLALLLKCVAYIDVVPDLNEYMVSVGSIEEMLNEKPNAPHELRDLFNEVKKFDYVNLTTI